MLGGRGLMALLALQVGGSQPTEAQEEGYGLPLIEEIRVRVELNEEAMRLMRMRNRPVQRSPRAFSRVHARP